MPSQCAGKVNNITIDKCTKMGIVFTVSKEACTCSIGLVVCEVCCIKNDLLFACFFILDKQDVVAAFEIVNCNGVEVQCQVSFFFFLVKGIKYRFLFIKSTASQCLGRLCL